MSKNLSWLLLVCTLIFSLYSTFALQNSIIGKKVDIGNHLVLLAQRFAKGEVSLDPLNRPTTDIVDIGGRQYLYFGPFPSLVLIPAVLLFKSGVSQTYLGVISLVVTFAAIFYLASKNKFNRENSLWLAVAFCFSTVLFGVSILGLTSYTVQAVGVALTFLALAEFFGKNRPLLIGALIAAAGMTRIGLYLGLIFFLLAAAKDRNFVKTAIYLMIPIAISLLILGAYNYKRFRSPFETGYKFQTTALSYPMSKNIIPGMVSLAHLPTNLYVFLAKPPDPVLEPYGGYVLRFPYLQANPWGMGLFFTSPIFLFLINLRRSKYFWPLLITTIVLAIPSMFYFGIGFAQFGYRYGLDFLPFLFILLLTTFEGKLLWRHKIFILLGVLFNCLYLGSLFGVYPLLGVNF